MLNIVSKLYSMRVQEILLTFILMINLSYSVEAQELCNDGIDNDGDGYIDCYDNSCAGSDDCDNFYFGKDVSCQNTPTQRPDYFTKLKWTSNNRTASTSAFPVVGDIDGDGFPEMVVTNTLDQTISILDGVTGNTKKGPFKVGFDISNTSAIANLNDDDCSEIIVNGHENNHLRMYDCDFNIIWDVVTDTGNKVGIISIADFNHDGKAEILHGNEIRDASNGKLLMVGTGDFKTEVIHGTVAIDILDDAACSNCTGLEIVAGGKVYSVNTSGSTWTKQVEKNINDYLPSDQQYAIKFQDTNFNSVSVADYNFDGALDVFLGGGQLINDNVRTTVFYWDVKNEQVLTYHPSTNHENGTGRISVADANGDGNLNTAFISGNKIYVLEVLENELKEVWTRDINQELSGFNACSLFDVNDDGAFEIIYRDEKYIQILDGTNGNDKDSINTFCSSRTFDEYPIVVDVDGDGRAEICVACATNDTENLANAENAKFGQIRVFEADKEIWQPVRSVWNQHAYYNVNINDDLSIPIKQQDPSFVFSTNVCTTGDNRPLNTFMNQSSFRNSTGCPSYPAADVEFISIKSIQEYECNRKDFYVTSTIRNGGDIAIVGNMPITHYVISPEDIPDPVQKLNTEWVHISKLLPGEIMDITTKVYGLGGDYELLVSLNDDGDFVNGRITRKLIECTDVNNFTSISVSPSNFNISHKVISNEATCEGSTSENGSARVFYFDTELEKIDTLWVEDFESLEYGDQENSGESTWIFTETPVNASRLEVTASPQNKELIFAGTKEEAIWESKTINIMGLDEVRISLNLASNSNNEINSDYIRAYYILDDKEEIAIDNGVLSGHFGYVYASTSNISGHTLKLRIKASNDQKNEFFLVDNIIIKGVNSSQLDESLYDFYWFKETNFEDTLFVGSEYASLEAGSYSVVGTKNDECFSNIETIIISKSTETNLIRSNNTNPESFEKCENGELTLSLVEAYASYQWESKATESDDYANLGTAPTQVVTDESIVRASMITENGCSITADPISVSKAEKSEFSIEIPSANKIEIDPDLGKVIYLNPGQVSIDLAIDVNVTNVLWKADGALSESSNAMNHKVTITSISVVQKIDVEWKNIFRCVESDMLTLILDQTVLAIEDNFDEIKIFPNPVIHNFLNINANYNSMIVNIVDLLGQSVLSEQLTNKENRIDVSDIKNGIYILILRGEKNHAFKIVINN